MSRLRIVHGRDELAEKFSTIADDDYEDGGGGGGDGDTRKLLRTPHQP